MQQRRQPGKQGPLRRTPGVSRSAGRSTDRPAAARRPAAEGAAKRTRAPGQRGLTGRATALLIILAALALGYAYPVRVYLTQMNQIESMTQAQAQQRQHIESLEEEAAKWEDENYVRIQLRKRFFWVRKGEIPLYPVWESNVDTGKKPEPPKPKNWYETLYSSVDAANG